MLKFLFGGKKNRKKSVNDVRRKKAPQVEPQSSQAPDLEDRIKARRARNLRMADIKAALAQAGPIERPDISGAIEVAKAATKDLCQAERKAAIDRALRLKGSARVIDETLADPAWRYVALAIVRGLMEEAPDTPSKSSRKAQAAKGKGS